MLVEFALFILILSFCFAVVQFVIPSWGLAQNNHICMATAKPCAVVQFVLLTMSLAGLVYAFLTNDFSIQYVADHSTYNLPWYYKIGAVWGGHEGSFFLWIVMINGWSTLWLWFNYNAEQRWVTRVLSIMGVISAGFLFFLIQTSNPFVRNYESTLSFGRDLNPLLQDPGLLMHPPMLYFGYVGFVIVFALALAGLLENNISQQWGKATKPWATIAWMMLTLGIILGSWWAYHVLGWGGWWFWDPVENAALLPWLVATALIHSLMVTERTGSLKRWSLFLAILVFILCIIGTFLVRSGILVSVHAFANDPSRGLLLLILFSIIGFIAFIIYAKRASYLLENSQPFQLLSRESAILANNLLLLVMMGTILLGILYPVVIQVLGFTPLSIGAPYFNTVFIPLAIPLILLMGIAPECYWIKSNGKALFKIVSPLMSISIFISLIASYLLIGSLNFKMILGIFLSSWLFLSTTNYYIKVILRRKKISLQHLGVFFAHNGVAMMILAITIVSNMTLQTEVRVAPGEQFKLGEFSFTLNDIKNGSQSNYDTLNVYFRIDKKNAYLATMKAEQRQYSIAQTVLNTVSIKATLFYDLYLVLGEQFNDGSWAIRAYYKPLIRWLWIGGLLLLLGGLIGIIKNE